MEECTVKGTYVLVINTLEQNQLSVSPLRMGLVLKGPAQLLHSDWDAKYSVQSGA